MIERLESKQIEETNILYDIGGTIIAVIKTGEMATIQPSLKEVIDKTNQIIDKLNEGEKKEEPTQVPKTYAEEWGDQFEKLKKAMTMASINLGGNEMKNKPIFKQLSKGEIQDKQIAAMDIDLKFLWDKAKVNEKKTNELESKTTRMDEGCKDMWERTQADRKSIKALEGEIKLIKWQEEIRHDREVEQRQAKARKKANVVSSIETILLMIMGVFALIGVVALTIGL